MEANKNRLIEQIIQSVRKDAVLENKNQIDARLNPSSRCQALDTLSFEQAIDSNLGNEAAPYKSHGSNW
ncbi:hypothetical protein AKJ16_DCAP24507 [Drosera capensis]